MGTRTKNFILDLLFPQHCLGCQKDYNPPTASSHSRSEWAPGSYLCQDCQACLEILANHQKYQTKNLDDLYFTLPYQNPLIKNLIQKFKYQPFIKELSKTLASLIINHFQLLDNKPNFFYPVRDRKSSNGVDFILIPVPLYKKKLKWRGFNQAEEIAKELSSFLRISLISDCLIKTKTTQPQVELSEREREENIKNAFSVKNEELIKNKKILLIDDIYTTGATMKECARVLKEAGAKEIIGIVIARAKPEEDYFQNV